jgi:hypothetical protein
MGRINWGRVFLGGIVAGIVINAFEYVTNGIFLGPSWDAAMKALGRQMPPSAVSIFILNGFLTGIGAIWLYAVARPRFGPGAKTAALTGFGFWVIGYLLPTIAWAAMHLFPHRLTAISAAVGLPEIILASIAGAALYKE